uniref:MG7 n=1 Tax=Spodoptera litura TaxID=69820 RepID=I1VZI8_SPOLT|nr:MG7 [Spodoptera litura]
MTAKLLVLLVVVAALAEAQVTQITLPDENRNHISNPLIGFGISIPKFWFDILQSCHVIYPNGFTYEVYPNNNLPAGPISFTPAVQPFTACGVGFLHPPESFSGVYELMSLVNHTDASFTLTRQRFNIVITMSELWQADDDQKN